MDRTGEAALHAIARARDGLVTRGDVLACGGSDSTIGTQVATGRWTRLQAGVYLIGVAPLTWRTELLAATLGAGPGAVASHRAAVVLWELDGLGAAPLEITVSFASGPSLQGVLQHRTRRPVPMSVVEGVPVTAIERTLLDAAGCIPPSSAEKAVECALRRGLTTTAALDRQLTAAAGRGVRGSGFLRGFLAERPEGRAAGSPAEAELVRALRLHGVTSPVRQHPVRLLDRSLAVLDLAWPVQRKAVEVDGLDAHATATALEGDDERQNQLFEVGYQLRRYSARAVHRDPDAVVASVLRFLAA